MCLDTSDSPLPSSHLLPPSLVSEPDPQKIGRRVWEIGWGRSVPSGMYGICNY